MNGNYDYRDMYLHTIEKMLLLGKLRIADIYPIVRLIRPHLYGIALKTSCLISKERFLEDIKLLKNDILDYETLWAKLISTDEIPQSNKQQLLDIFKRYLKTNRFKGAIDVEQYKINNTELQYTIDMNSNKICSIDYIEHTKHQFEISGYEDNIYRLLLERKITMKDLDRTIRISNPKFYLHGLRAGVGYAGSLLQTLELLSGDIDSIAEEDNHIKETLIEKLLAYIDPLRYHNDNEDVLRFSENAMKKYKTTG